MIQYLKSEVMTVCVAKVSACHPQTDYSNQVCDALGLSYTGCEVYQMKRHTLYHYILSMTAN